MIDRSKSIGALYHISIDFEYESGYHKEKREEEKCITAFYTKP